MARRELGQIADEAMTVCGENRFQGDLVRCLRRRGQVGEICRSQIACGERGERAGYYVLWGGWGR
jgi:hypothetical protein